MRKTIKRIVVFALAVIVGLGEPLVCYATNYEQQREQTQQKLDQARQKKSDAEDQAEALSNEANEVKEELDDATTQLDNLYAEIDTTNGLIEDTNSNIEQLESDLEDAESDREEQYELLKRRIAFNYETTSGWNLVTAFFEAGSVMEFLDRIDYMLAVAEYDQQILSEYESAIETINTKNEELNNSRLELADYQQELADSQTELDALVGEKTNEYNAKEGELSDALDDVDSADAEIQQLQDQMASLEASQAAAQAAMAQQIAEQQAAAQAAAAAQNNANRRSRTESTTNSEETTEDSGTSEGDGEETEGEDEGEEVTPEDVIYPEEDTSGAVDATESDVILLAATIQAEAGNQSYEGKLAVGSVIMNRVNSSCFPGTIYGVISQPNQFEPWRKGIITRIVEAGPNDTCIEIANAVIAGTRNGSWLYFMTPYWADYFGITGYETIGGHAFFWRWGDNR